MPSTSPQQQKIIEFQANHNSTKILSQQGKVSSNSKFKIFYRFSTNNRSLLVGVGRFV
jgi:hypothetical protein